jgi:drug/metabolite transporter (DMT)-like permease
MKTHPRLTGLCLLLISIGFFFAIDLDKGGAVLGLCGFLLFFVSGWLVIFFFWNDGDITKLRRIHEEKKQGHAFKVMPVQERTFRYPAMKGARLAVMVCLCLFMLAMAIAALYLIISNENRADAAAMEALYFVFALFASCTIFFCWLTWRYARLFIRIDGNGITAFTYFGLRHAGWEDIIAVRDWIPFRGLVDWLSDFFASDFTLYKIYTRNHLISFSSSMPGADELAKLIKANAGLPE